MKIFELLEDRSDVTQTPEFKRWFGNSKVVDGQGKPLVLYRGVYSWGEIPSAALNAEARKGYATFATNNPAIANTYANPDFNDRLGSQESTGAVIPVYVKANELIEFPVQVSYRDGWRSFDMFEFDRRARGLSPGQVLVVRGVTDTGPRSNIEVDPERKWSYPSDMYAWGPGTSAKSAISNNGKFDPNNPDITKEELI